MAADLVSDICFSDYADAGIYIFCNPPSGRDILWVLADRYSALFKLLQHLLYSDHTVHDAYFY